MNWVLVARAMQAVSFVAVVAFLVFAVVLDVPGLLTPGLVIVTLLGVDHPPIREDGSPLGAWRTVLGLVSLLIPVVTFMPEPLLFD